MLPWSKPKCPILPGDKAWVEQRLNWLCAEFGDSRFLSNAPILPTAEFFPAEFDGSEASVEVLFHRVCHLMGVPRGTAKLDFYVDDRNRMSSEMGQLLGINSVSRGLFEDGLVPTVLLERSILSNPHIVVAVLAHELSHVRLMNEERVSRDTPDNEALTDLTAIFFGFGIFTVGHCSNVSHWSKEDGYLSKPIAAYALAHHAWARSETKPDWLSHLDGESRSWCRSALKFLLKTGDTDFSPLPLDLLSDS